MPEPGEQRCDVLVIGGGPVGLFAAAALARSGLECVLWERRAAAGTHSRAIGIHAPSLRAFEAIGVTDPLLAEAVLVRYGHVRSGGRTHGTVPFARASTRYPFVATLAQHRTEALLTEAAQTASATHGPGPLLRRGVELTSLNQTPDRVRATGRVPDGEVRLSARFVVAADGARSTARALLGVPAATDTYPDTFLMGDVADTTADGPDAVIHLAQQGVVESFPLPGAVRRFVAATTAAPVEPSVAALAALVRGATGHEFDQASCTMLSAFGVRRTLAARMSAGRVALVGDAAHEISPIGGQGMNLGWLDVAELVPILREALCSGGSLEPARLAAWDARRRAIARQAARQAGVNMALGRAGGALGLASRLAGLRLVLATPARHPLARVYAMGG